mmetsp:Transcript_5611/g.9665  ORF Transcript_5611/g.9665 Transcript_5611/m.9665 type:complete len:138 (+) Transcript_5611:1183-1596(+)
MSASNSENFEDMIEDKIFKYKYKQNADDQMTYHRRMERVVDRFYDRAETRHPLIEQNLNALLQEHDSVYNLGTLFADPDKFIETGKLGSDLLRDYMYDEAILQYMDYFESEEEEEQEFFQHLRELPPRDRIRFIEIF